MIHKSLRILTLSFTLAVAIAANAQQKAFEHPIPGSSYFGQKVPQTQPELFAPGVVNTPMHMHGNIVFAPELNEAFWHPDEPKGLYFSRMDSGKWMTPR